MGTMADFPPNPEDGELWLPSDVFHEIVSATIKPERSNSHQAFVKNAALDHVAIQRKSSAAARSLSEAVSKFQITQHACCSFPGSKPNGNGAAARAVPAFDHGASWVVGGYSLFPGRILLYNPIPPTQPKDFEKAGKQKSRRGSLRVIRDEVKSFAGKSGGTGVFLPRSTDASEAPEQTMNTGVFLNHHHAYLTSGKTNKSGKKGQGNRKKSVYEIKGSLEEQEESQISDEIGLPQEWTY
ncbi:hypothetical protein F2P56_010696 [Juglans regia]|uniref:Uncharacterized protein LOC108987563 n=2 Tax=Juglans regia TaxID=51240 RepID=A0A2I4E9G4_JUGRE|nr:uncharacterized protein LOC108987563 [Juglans regia]KAF5470164.1 hypothetical protein F2P56_010696 [Juglans regia]